MKDVFLVALGVAVGFWMRGCSNKRKQLEEDNAILLAKLREEEARKKGAAQ